MHFTLLVLAYVLALRQLHLQLYIYYKLLTLSSDDDDEYYYYYYLKKLIITC